jgi:hypothetical protein
MSARGIGCVLGSAGGESVLKWCDPCCDFWTLDGYVSKFERLELATNEKRQRLHEALSRPASGILTTGFLLTRNPLF